MAEEYIPQETPEERIVTLETEVRGLRQDLSVIRDILLRMRAETLLPPRSEKSPEAAISTAAFTTTNSYGRPDAIGDIVQRLEERFSQQPAESGDQSMLLQRRRVGSS